MIPRVIDRHASLVVRIVLTLTCCFVAFLASAQSEGNFGFGFLRLPGHARLAALGGVNVSLADRDVHMFHENPALIGDTLQGFASAGYQFFVADIGSALFSCAYPLSGFGPLLVGVRHTGYGTLAGYDDSGMETAAFSPAETAISAGTTHQIGHFRLGVTIRTVFSAIAGYRATALMTDLGGVFLHPQEDLTVGLVLKNVGFVVSDYRETGTSSVPFDVHAGVTFKPEHMPVRFSFTGYHLLQSRLLWEGPGLAESSVFKEVLSHINAGAEILLHRNVNLLAGYNYLLHQGLQVEGGRLGAGISYGFSLFVKPVEFVFSRNPYTVGNAGYSFTLAVNTNDILKNRKL